MMTPINLKYNYTEMSFITAAVNLAQVTVAHNRAPFLTAPSSMRYVRTPSQPSPIWQAVKEEVLPWIQAMPSHEETSEKIHSMAHYLGFLGAFVFAGVSGMAALQKVPTGQAVKNAAIGVGVAMGVEVIRSILEEAALKRQAALSRGRETVVYVCAKDGTPTSHVPGYHDAVRELAQGKKFVFQRISSPDELRDLLMKQKKISHLVIAMHGNRREVAFSEYKHYTGSQIASYLPLDQFTPSAQIILKSCSTGDYLTYCFAKELHAHLKGRVEIIAPQKNISGSDARFKDGNISFTHWGEDITTRLPKK